MNQEDSIKQSNSILVYSFITLLLFCLPLGAAAVAYSLQSRKRARLGDLTLAARHAKIASTLNVIGLVIGTIVWLELIYYISRNHL